MGIPVVSKDTTNSVIHELTKGMSSDYLANLLKHVREKNPQVAEFLAAFAMKHEDPLAISTVGLLVYRLLESQAEADQLRVLMPVGDAAL
ncbi:MAG: hypothetical protein E3J72_09075 [Planctomycetota bacterium]|nr:MAG: hypothetical protein E3J72_09075 [Planctomycetota bacterium]